MKIKFTRKHIANAKVSARQI